jgi:hypothetical protein
MVMQEQARRLSEPLRWGRRERILTATLVTVVVLALAALGAYALTSGAPARRDCIDLTFASTLGGAKIHACGQRARTICAAGQLPHLQQELRDACEHAGFAYRPPR